MNVLNELEAFLKELDSYLPYASRLSAGERLKQTELSSAGKLRYNLRRKVGRFRALITELTGKDKVVIREKGHEFPADMWTLALRLQISRLTLSALCTAIDTTNEAIGRLEADIEKGYRDEKGDVIEKPFGIKTERPKAFISHGKESSALIKLEGFLRALGVDPLITKEQASLDKTVPDKINCCLRQSDCVVILATGDDEIEGRLYPRQNVIHETGLAQETHGGRIIYLLEEGTEFPSNISPKVWQRFKQDNMEDVFQCIVIELKALNILRTAKPPPEEFVSKLS